MSDAIRRWLRGLPGWETANVERLEGGRSNETWRLSAGTRAAVLKVDAEPRSAPSNTRAEEAAAQALAARAGLASAVLWHSPEGILTGWLEGSETSDTDLAVDTTLSAVAVALCALHELPRTGRDYDFAEWARHYRERLEVRKRFDANLEAAFDLLQGFEPPGPQVFSHNDLVPANIIRGRTIAFIDFEYARDNSALFDLATLIVEAGLDSDAQSVLLSAYFGSEPTPHEALDEMIDAYRAMRLLWEASRLPAVP